MSSPNDYAFPAALGALGHGLPNRRVAAPDVEPIQFAPVAIVFRTAGEDGVTAAGASPSMRPGFAGNENPFSRRAIPKRILAMTAARLVLASAPAPAKLRLDVAGRDRRQRHLPSIEVHADQGPLETTRYGLWCNVVPRVLYGGSGRLRSRGS